MTLLAAAAWSHEENEPRERDREVRTDRRETREERRVRETGERRVNDAEDAYEDAEKQERDLQHEADENGELIDDSGSGSVDSDNSGPGGSGSNVSGDGADDDSDDDRHDRDDSGRGSPVRFEVERDAAGHERVRQEVLMVADAASINTVRGAGYAIVAIRPLAAFSELLARIRVRPGSSVEQAISELQALAPLASIAPHHLFRPSAEDMGTAVAERAATPSTVATDGSGHVGVIDTGADVAWPVLARAIVRTAGFADGGYTSRTHGTLVAEIVARSGAQLSMADVFGVDGSNRLIAPAAAIASAIDWLVENKVRVLNISIEGPDNIVLAYVIRRALAADVVIVAAAGNSGPAAAPAFPAAYPGVIAVTAVDERGQVYRRANRGEYIAFAARGVHVASAYEAAASKTVSGTSFASPVVAATIARRLDAAAGVGHVLNSLKSEARDLGAPGRDAIYGWGELEEPSALTADSRH